jgi:hypothetical protein
MSDLASQRIDCLSSNSLYRSKTSHLQRDTKFIQHHIILFVLLRIIDDVNWNLLIVFDIIQSFSSQKNEIHEIVLYILSQKIVVIFVSRLVVNVVECFYDDVINSLSDSCTYSVSDYQKYYQIKLFDWSSRLLYRILQSLFFDLESINIVLCSSQFLQIIILIHLIRLFSVV